MHSKGFCTRLLVYVLCAFAYHMACNDSHGECFDVESKSKCYFIPNVSLVDWDTAWKTCKELNANLPVIMNNEGQKVLEGYLRKHFSNQPVWTAGKYVGSDSEWSWLNGEVDRETEIPPCLNKQSQCVHRTQAVLTKELKYSAQYPHNSYAFICEFPGVACITDSQNSVRWKDGCLSWTNKPQLPLNKARHECLKGGGDLATFSDKEDIERLQKVPSLKKYADNEYYWVGLHRKWWIWNTTDKPDIKYNLLDEYGEQENACLFINQLSSKWSRDKCSERKNFICESEKSSTENKHFEGFVAIGITIAVLAVSVAVVISLIFIRKRCCVVGTEVTKSDAVTSSQNVEYQDNTYATIDEDFENLNFEHGSNPATLCKNVETCAKPLTAYSQPADCDTSEHNRSTAVYSEPYGSSSLTPVLKNLAGSSSDIYHEVNELGQQKQSDELASPPIKIGPKGDVYTLPISNN